MTWDGTQDDSLQHLNVLEGNDLQLQRVWQPLLCGIRAAWGEPTALIPPDGALPHSLELQVIAFKNVEVLQTIVLCSVPSQKWETAADLAVGQAGALSHAVEAINERWP